MPPVVHLEQKWIQEYGMPSTHSMVGLAVPSSILFFTVGRYLYPFHWWASVALVWCVLVCTSRLYLGVHSLAVSHDVRYALKSMSIVTSDILNLSD